MQEANNVFQEISSELQIRKKCAVSGAKTYLVVQSCAASALMSFEIFLLQRLLEARYASFHAKNFEYLALMQILEVKFPTAASYLGMYLASLMTRAWIQTLPVLNLFFSQVLV